MGKIVKLKLFFLIIAIALIAFFWYFRGAAPKGVPTTAPQGGPTITPPTSPPPGESGEEISSLQRFTIEGDEFRFSPKNISVTRGATVELTFKNVGNAPHNFTIDELGLATKTIGGGKTDVVSFVAPDTAGIVSYSSYCSVPGHREAGMVGTIEIK